MSDKPDIPNIGETREIDVTAIGDSERKINLYRFESDLVWRFIEQRSEPLPLPVKDRS